MIVLCCQPSLLRQDEKRSYMKPIIYAALLSLSVTGSAFALPKGDYDCTPSTVFQFDETGQSFGVASVLSTDTIFELHPPQDGGTLLYQAGGATYLIDPLEDDYSRFKYRVVYSGDLRTFTGFCKPLEDS